MRKYISETVQQRGEGQVNASEYVSGFLVKAAISQAGTFQPLQAAVALGDTAGQSFPRIRKTKNSGCLRLSLNLVAAKYGSTLWDF
jgi:hypothetical protein